MREHRQLQELLWETILNLTSICYFLRYAANIQIYHHKITIGESTIFFSKNQLRQLPNMTTNPLFSCLQAPHTETPTPWHQDESYWLDMPDKRAASCWVSSWRDVYFSNYKKNSFNLSNCPMLQKIRKITICFQMHHHANFYLFVFLIANLKTFS